jgi:hypothetical protein
MPKKLRKLWLRVQAEFPSGVGVKKGLPILYESLKEKEYALPEGYSATILWKNKLLTDWRDDDWETALTESAKNSTGFDFAVMKYLERVAAKYHVKLDTPRKASESETEEALEREDESTEDRAERKATKQRKKKPARKHTKAARHRAALKGWRTRRARKSKKMKHARGVKRGKKLKA